MSIEKIIIGLIASLFMALASTIIIIKQVSKKKNCLLFFLLFWAYFIFVAFLVKNQLRFLFFVTYACLSTYFVLQEKSKKVILYAFNTEILLVTSEILISILLTLFGINSVKLVDNPIYNLCANILISLCACLLIFVPFVKWLIYRLIKLFDKNKKLINYLYIFLFILYMLSLKNGFEFLLKSNYYINVLFIFGFVILILVFIKKEIKTQNLKQEYQQMLNYLTKYEKIITEQGKANHEFKNQLMVIKGYAQMQSPKLIEYLDSIASDLNKTHSSYLISQLNKFPDGGIKGLLYYKLSIMDDLKIDYQLDIENGIKTKLKDLDTETYKNITKVLGVLFDNAIDASRRSKNKNIVISVTKDTKCVNFSISNTYSGNIEIDKIGTGYTTKGSGHGYGLKLVNDIIEKYDNFTLNNVLEENYYTSKLTIKINKKAQNKK